MQIVTNNSITSRETASAKSLEEVVNASGVSEDPAKLIDWHVGVLREILKKIWARRAATFDFDSLEEVVPKSTGLVVDEVTEVIHLPEASDENHRHEDVELSPIVESQLHEFVSSICELYRDNPFHNFQHASRVTKSLEIFLNKVADSSEPHVDNYTYRLTSDPVTQFACIFAALIHDVDHAGKKNIDFAISVLLSCLDLSRAWFLTTLLPFFSQACPTVASYRRMPKLRRPTTTRASPSRIV